MNYNVGEGHMYGRSNGLGIGATGHTFQIVPPSMQMRQSHVVQQPQSQKQQQQKHVQFNIEKTADAEAEAYNQEPQEETQNRVQQEQQAAQQVQQAQQAQQAQQNEWSSIFNNVCSNQLYGCFRKVKSIISNSSYYRGTRVCYIDYDCMQKLIGKARSESSSKGLMSLKTYLRSSHQDVTDINDVEEAVTLVQSMEMMGPPDHALIPLQEDQIDFLKSKGCQEMFWPNGSNGITWIRDALQNQWTQ